MARQCLVAAIRHQGEVESSASVEHGLYQSRIAVSFVDMVMERAECEELGKVIIGCDEEKFFQIRDQLPS